MSSRKEHILICDSCGKEVSDGGGTWIGGHPHNGWLSVTRHGGDTTLESLKRKKHFDFCSVKCLKEYDYE